MNPIKDKVFMFTGTLRVTRSEAQRIVEELGGIAGSSVTRDTDYLVCGEDQVGKSSKWEKAGLLGVTRVDEDYFWTLVNEARKEIADENAVVVRIGDDISDEQLEIIAKECPNLRIMTEEQLIRLLKACSPSHENTDEYKLELLGPSTCKWCGSIIPYSIHTKATYSIPEGEYYCFTCKSFATHPEHRHVWLASEIKEGVYVCNYCGVFIEADSIWFKEFVDHVKSDDYYNSVEYLVDKLRKARREAELLSRYDFHVCDFVPELQSDNGYYGTCKTCGKFKFVRTDKIADCAKFDRNETDSVSANLASTLDTK